MKGVLADVNGEGQWKAVLRRLEGPYWREVWVKFNLQVETFHNLGLDKEVSDAVLWRLCQEKQLLLITCNRNKDQPDSLQAVIEMENTPECLPVFTLADPDRVLESNAYADRVAERLLQYLLEIDNVRGSGRLYLP
jgi:hypothetical protein